MARASVSPTRSATSSGAPPTHDGRVVTVGQLVLFSTETGSSPQAWPAIGIEENDTTSAIGWKGRRRRPVPPQSADRSSVHVPPAPPDPAPPGCTCRSPPCIWVRRRGRRSRPARLSRRAHSAPATSRPFPWCSQPPGLSRGSPGRPPPTAQSAPAGASGIPSWSNAPNLKLDALLLRQNDPSRFRDSARSTPLSSGPLCLMRLISPDLRSLRAILRS